MRYQWLKRFILLVMALLGVSLALSRIDQVALLQRSMLADPALYLGSESDRLDQTVAFALDSAPDTIQEDHDFLVQLVDELEGAIFQVRIDGKGEELDDPRHKEIYAYQAGQLPEQGIKGNPFLTALPASTRSDSSLLEQIILLDERFHGEGYDQFSFYPFESLMGHTIPEWFFFNIYYPSQAGVEQKLTDYFGKRIDISWHQDHQTEVPHIPFEPGPLWVGLLLLLSLLILRLTQSSRDIAIGHMLGQSGWALFWQRFWTDFVFGTLSFLFGLITTALILGRGFSPGAIVYFQSLIKVVGYFGMGMLILVGVFLSFTASFQRQMDSLVRTGVNLRSYPAILSVFRIIGVIGLIPLLIYSFGQYQAQADGLKYIREHPEAQAYYGLYSMAFYSQPRLGVDDEVIFRESQERIKQLPQLLSAHLPLHLDVRSLVEVDRGLMEMPEYPVIYVNHNFADLFLEDIYPPDVQPDELIFIHQETAEPVTEVQKIEALRPRRATYRTNLELHDPLLRLKTGIQNPSIWIYPDEMLGDSIFFPNTFFLPEPESDRERIRQDLLSLSVDPNRMFTDNSVKIRGMIQELHSLRNRSLVETLFSLISLLSLTVAIIQMACYSQKKRIAIAAMLESPKRRVYQELMVLMIIGSILPLAWLLIQNRDLDGRAGMILGVMLLFWVIDGTVALITIRQIERRLLPTIFNQQGS